jgi:hypothetical protein
MELFERIQFLRAEDGSYWTGWQFETRKHFPHEQSTWTAAAIVLAADVLASVSAADGEAERGNHTPAAGIFRDFAAGLEIWQAADPAACGCPADPG